MASILDDIKEEIASAGLEVAIDLGDTADYVANGSTNTLYVTAGGVNGNASETVGIRTNEDTRKFWISTQTGFPPTGGPSQKHVINYRSQQWAVTNAANPDGIGQRYEIDTVLTTGQSIKA